jgi:hypothetical protein
MYLVVLAIDRKTDDSDWADVNLLNITLLAMLSVNAVQDCWRHAHEAQLIQPFLVSIAFQ